MHKYHRFTVLFIGFVLLLSGCASTKVEMVGAYDKNKLPPPAKVLVYNFALSPENIELNRSVGAKVARYIKKKPELLQKMELGNTVANSLSTELVKQLQSLGLPTAIGTGVPPKTGNTLIIVGYFVNIDEGNRLSRSLIGFGAGHSEVKAHVLIYDNAISPQQLVAEFTTTAKSSRKPGIAPLTGAGAVLGRAETSLAVSSGVTGADELFGASPAADAKRTAKEIIKKLKPFLIEQGWGSSKS